MHKPKFVTLGNESFFYLLREKRSIDPKKKGKSNGEVQMEL